MATCYFSHLRGAFELTRSHFLVSASPIFHKTASNPSAVAERRIFIVAPGTVVGASAGVRARARIQYVRTSGIITKQARFARSQGFRSV